MLPTHPDLQVWIYNDIMRNEHIRTHDHRARIRLSKFDDNTVEPTNIIRMVCDACEKNYSAAGQGLMIDGKTGAYKPCIGLPANPLSSLTRCGSTSYTVWRKMELRAMPIGKKHNDLSRKHSL